VSREDWPEMSYTGAMMADLQRKGTAPPPRKVVAYRDRENVSEEERQKNKETVRLNARQRALLAHLESDGELPAPRYAGGYVGQKHATERLCRLGVWRVSWSDPVFEDDLPVTLPDR